MKGFRRCTSFLLLLLLGQQQQDALAFTTTRTTISQTRYQIPSKISSLRSANNRRSTTTNTQLKAVSSLPSIPSSWTHRWTSIVSSPKLQRPQWARDWMPTWLVTLRPTIQLATVVLLYIFHLTVLTQRSISFPFQLIPNERGHFESIGLDSLAGMATLGAYQYLRRQPKPIKKGEEEEEVSADINEEQPIISASNLTISALQDDSPWENIFTVPSLFSTPRLKDSPWKSIYQSKYSRFTSFLAMCALVQAYFWTGRLSIWWEDTFYVLANHFPITVAMHRALCVLFGHLSWIALGGTILRVIPRPQNFFKETWYSQNFKSTQWAWWTIGGYFVSSWFFNIADFLNQWILPISILEQAQESVVSQLINPEFNDWAASIVGYIAPCITAPWWEEVLYRGFLLPALVLQMKYKWAILWSGIIFSIHHMSPTACIPLAVLGWTWSILYAKSGNLLTTILVHAMWNSRIFLGSWLGL